MALEVVQEIEDDRTLFDCDLCWIQVSSKANLKLHDSLPMHQKSLEKSTDREMGENREKNLKKLKINLILQWCISVQKEMNGVELRMFQT